MSTSKQTVKPSSEQTELGFERLVFFTDAVMAIAITLLVIDLRLPEIPQSLAAAELPGQLNDLTPRIVSFVISFAVVGIYWSSHHRYFNYIKRYDGRLIGLNLVFLLFIVLMPFAASLLGQYSYLPVAVIVYALDVAATGFSIGAIWWYASYNHRLVDRTLDRQFIRERNAIALVIPLIFLASVPFAWLSPLASMVVWWLTPLAAMLVIRLRKKRPVKRH